VQQGFNLAFRGNRGMGFSYCGTSSSFPRGLKPIQIWTFFAPGSQKAWIHPKPEKLLHPKTAPQATGRLFSGLFGCSWASRSAVCLDIVGIPGQVALEPVFEMRWRLEFVIFGGIDNQLRFAAQSL
jgi:hypothetical protein